MQQTFMKEKKILPLVISMSLPMVISMAVNSMYNIVDSYFVAMMSEDAMTALALVYPVQNLITAIGVGFGVGINAAVAFYLGAEDDRLSAKASSMGLGLSVLHGIILTIVTVSCKMCIRDRTVSLQFTNAQTVPLFSSLINSI